MLNLIGFYSCLRIRRLISWIWRRIGYPKWENWRSSNEHCPTGSPLQACHYSYITIPAGHLPNRANLTTELSLVVPIIYKGIAYNEWIKRIYKNIKTLSNRNKIVTSFRMLHIMNGSNESIKILKHSNRNKIVTSFRVLIFQACKVPSPDPLTNWKSKVSFWQVWSEDKKFWSNTE